MPSNVYYFPSLFCKTSLIAVLFLLLTGPCPPFRFLLLTISGASTSQGQCPQWINDQVQRCVQPVAEYAKVLNQQQTSQNNQSTPSPNPTMAHSEFGQALQFPKLGGQVFSELCSRIKEFERCAEEYRNKCRKHITIDLIEASYGFLCNEGFETFMESADCLMDLDQRPSVKRCHDETLREIEEANRELPKISMNEKLERMCSALNFFSGCVRHPIRANCGMDAWQVIFRVLKDTTKTLMPQCQFTGRISSTHSSSRNNDQQVNEQQRTRRPIVATKTTTTTTAKPWENLGPNEWLRESEISTDFDTERRRSPTGGGGHLPNVEIEISQQPEDSESFANNVNRDGVDEGRESNIRHSAHDSQRFERRPNTASTTTSRITSVLITIVLLLVVYKL